MATVDSKIERVRIYQSGATVYRTIQLTSDSGRLEEEIEIPQLPLALADATVRLRVAELDSPQAELVAGAVHVGLYVAPRQDLPEEPNHEEWKKVSREIVRLESTLEQYQLEISALGNIDVPDRPEGEEGKPPPSSPLTARLALESFVTENVELRVKECRNLEEQLFKLKERARELAQLAERARRARTVDADEITKTVIVRLRQGEAPIKRARVVLEYFVPGARWAPAYQCRLSGDSTKAEIQLRALICQRSGEDWRGVHLTLSTAAPISWTELPELTAIRIGKAQPTLPSPRGFRPAPSGGAFLFHDFDEGRKVANGLLPPVAAGGLALPAFAPLRVSPDASAHAAAPSELSSRGPSRAARAAMMVEKEKSEAMTLEHDMMSLEDADYSMVEESLAEDDELTPAEHVLSAPPAPSAMAMGASLDQMSAKLAPSEPRRRTAAPSRAKKASVKGRSVERSLDDAAGLEAVVFSDLRLGSPFDAVVRNKLHPVEQRDAYLETLGRAGLKVETDVLTLVNQAISEARHSENTSLPHRASPVHGGIAGFDYVYDGDVVVDVPSDGRFHSVTLGVRVCDCDMRYVVAPRVENHVYRVARLTNPISAPFLPGPAEIYVGGEYVLTTEIPVVPPQGSFQLGLGVEQAIKCARNTRYRESRADSKVVGTNDLWHSIQIDLVNNLDREIRCEVRERIPQPAEDAEVVVEEATVDPPWEPYEQEERHAIIKGGRRWAVTVPAKSKTELSAEYVVKIYTQNELVGGNRREV